jgi:hypothetical protein
MKSKKKIKPTLLKLMTFSPMRIILILIGLATLLQELHLNFIPSMLEDNYNKSELGLD